MKYPKISVDGYIFLHFILKSLDIAYIENISVIYPNLLNLAHIQEKWTLIKHTKTIEKLWGIVVIWT